MRRRLPIGIQSFVEIRRGGYYYVDKTRFVLKLVEEGKY
ncbi:MAG: AAA family ATPase, partial [Candidatus Calescibacterium sp.]|nr:AAA family ATPase [Candidatus Calescibacterium sp.]